MTSAHDSIPVEDQQAIMECIYQDNQKLRPISLSDIQGVRFFPWHNNTFEAWFVRANYVHTSELWFVVDLRGSCIENGWWIEQIF